MKVKVKKHKTRRQMLNCRPDTNCRHTIKPFFGVPDDDLSDIPSVTLNEIDSKRLVNRIKEVFSDYTFKKDSCENTSSEKPEPFLTEDVCGRKHLKKTIFDRLNSLELDIEKGAFSVNGEDFSKVDYFSLTFEHGEYHLSFRNNYFCDGEIKRSFKHERD